ncbi:hypothetical protein JN01_0446 [Entomoplasma freundtii]|uniref:Uncharacterized protein n=1 Tax=Entomoplasma freundtii TaxID=74700 RepID=A0A2K8NQU2_9MOLU|nr:hypothetical protein [Entomoplasma freundtii]ATZ16154.1 hypothetical protein EFREU_v1c01270 [Entomoplasma freundtii]TDY56945.1 hypothetical protein JN01_0446 [Entomoplasma freundtii]
MTKLLLLLSTTLVPIQVSPLLVTNFQNKNVTTNAFKENNASKPQTLEKLEMTVSARFYSDGQLAASLYDLFIHNDISNLEQKEIHQKLQSLTRVNVGVDLLDHEKEVEEWINEQTNKDDYFKIRNFEGKYLDDFTYREVFIKALSNSINEQKQPIILQSKGDCFLILGYDSETQEFFVGDSDKNGSKEWMEGVELLERLKFESEVAPIFIIAAKDTLKILGSEPREVGKVGLVKQELSYYHLPAAMKSLLAAHGLDYSQNDLYKELRKITGTPGNTEGIIIKDQEVSDYINKLTSADFGTFNLGQGFGIMKDETVAFNKSIQDSLKKNHPLILTNQTNSFVISEIEINEKNPWLSTITGMNPEKGKMVEVTCQRLTWFNRENTYLIGEKSAIENNVSVKSSEVAIDQKIVEMNNLEDGLDVKAFEIEINLTELTSVQNISRIKQNLVSFELPEFSTQIFKIDGNLETKTGLVLSTNELPDSDVQHWKGEIKSVLEFEDETTNEKIKTWVKSRIIIDQDFLGDLNLTIQILVGAESKQNKTQEDSQRLTGKVNLNSGKIFKVNRN